MIFMKKLISKLSTLLVVLLIIVGAVIIIWLLGLIGQLASSDNTIVGSISFAFLSLGVLAIFICFINRRGKLTFSDKDNAKQEMLKEDIYNEIKGKHSS